MNASEAPQALPANQPQALPANQPQALPANQPQALPANQPQALPANQPQALPANQPQALAASQPAAAAASQPEFDAPRQPQFRAGTKAPRKILAGTELRRAVEARARLLGFEAVRVTRPDAVPELKARLPAWLAARHHGAMDWMEERADQRADPATLWPGVRSVVMLGMNYGPEADPRAVLARTDRGAIAAYAQRRDYHEVVKGKLKELGGYLSAKGDVRVKVFVDTAPVMEKPLAAAAGLGWQGKHTVLVSRSLGNWLLLGAIYTSAELEPDAPEADHCGSCRRCLDICPTNAFPAPYQLDARRCIAYLTIEHAGPIPTEFRAAIGNRVFGCDDCLAVCPWNKFAAVAAQGRMAARADLAAPPLAALAGLDEAAFRAHFAGTPVKRTGRDRFLRNVLIAIGNSGEPGLAAAAEANLSDPSPLVRGMAVWALGRLVPRPRLQDLFNGRGLGETDDAVRAEWRLALDPAGSETTGHAAS